MDRAGRCLQRIRELRAPLVRILVVEDEADIREGLREQLTQAGFAVDVAANGQDGLHAGLEQPIDIAVIDLGLPLVPGLDVIRKLRQKGKSFPILILTARDRWQDKVEGLDAGADDYVAKPFHFEEVLARVQALMRRSGGWSSAELVCGPVVLDTKRQTVHVNGKPIELTTYEYRMLENFMLASGACVVAHRAGRSHLRGRRRRSRQQHHRGLRRPIAQEARSGRHHQADGNRSRPGLSPCARTETRHRRPCARLEVRDRQRRCVEHPSDTGPDAASGPKSGPGAA